MTAYCLFENLSISDAAQFDDYKARVGATVNEFGGRYLVLAADVDVVEGDWRPGPLVMIEFPSLEQAHRWYDSAAYRELKAQRLASGSFNAVFIPGIPAS